MAGLSQGSPPTEGSQGREAAEPYGFKLACVYKMVTGPLVKCSKSRNQMRL